MENFIEETQKKQQSDLGSFQRELNNLSHVNLTIALNIVELINKAIAEEKEKADNQQQSYLTAVLRVKDLATLLRASLKAGQEAIQQKDNILQISRLLEYLEKEQQIIYEDQELTGN